MKYNKSHEANAIRLEKDGLEVKIYNLAVADLCLITHCSADPADKSNTQFVAMDAHKAAITLIEQGYVPVDISDTIATTITVETEEPKDGSNAKHHETCTQAASVCDS